MRPKNGSDIVEIPISFNGSGGMRLESSSRTLWFYLIIGFWVFSSIIALILADWGWKIGYPLLSLFLLSYIVRYVVFRERYYRAKRRELVKRDYLYDHSIFWNIYDVSARYPHIAQFGDGVKGVFVALDKDVIVGKGKDNKYHHHEEIAEAYRHLEKRNIEFIHIDYMDIVGKDERLAHMLKTAEQTQNKDLRNVMLRMYDHLEYKMGEVYSSYDVYCFYSNLRDDIFWDELQVALAYFERANYIRARVLTKDEITTLVKSLMNIDDFSLNRANDVLFRQMNKTEYLRPIWVEKDGERTVLNKTRDEMEEDKRVKQSEKKVKRKNKNKKGIFKKKVEENDIDLFE